MLLIAAATATSRSCGVSRRRSPSPDVAVALVSPDARTPCSGMLPGLVAGHYTIDEAHIDLVALAGRARARFVRDRVVALDPGDRRAQLARHPPETFDLLSLDIGSTPPAASTSAGRRRTRYPA